MTQGTQKTGTTEIRDAIQGSLQSAGGPLTTSAVAAAVAERLGGAVPGHRVRYGLEQLEAGEVVLQAKAGGKTTWSLVSVPAAEPATEAVEYMRETAGEPIDPATSEPAAAATAEPAPAPRPVAKKRTSGRKAAPAPEATPAPKPARTPKAKAEPKATESAFSADQVTDAVKALGSNGIREKLAAVLSDGRARPGSEVARLVGVASRLQRVAFDALVAKYVEAGDLVRDGSSVTLAPLGSLVDAKGLFAGVCEALGAGATPGSISITVTGPALVAVARLLGLNVRDGSKLTRGTANRPAGFWPILSRNGSVLDDATKAPIGSWQESGGQFAAALRDGRSFTAGSRRELQSVIVESVSSAPLPAAA